MTTFAGLGLRAEMVAVLDAQGITEPFPIQAATVSDSLAGRDVCGKAKTGSGKTLAFGLPLLQRVAADPGHGVQALVLVPTRELARQVYEVLAPLAESLDMTIAAIYGGEAMDKQVRAIRKGASVLVATPGRLIDLVDRGEASLSNINTIVVDEADRMADMGFLPQVEWLLRKVPETRQTLLFSATLDGDVDVLVRRYMHDPVRHEVQEHTTTVADMAHCFLAVHELDRIKVAAAICRGSVSTIIFVRTKRGADRLCDQLKREGIEASPLHGDLRQSARDRAMRQFSGGRVPVLVATDVAARGLHIDDIETVLQFDPPEDHKNYLHRAGRTARAGRTGVVATFVLWNQKLEIEKMQRRLGLSHPPVEVFSNDPRLADLAGTLASPATPTAVAG